MQKNINGAVFDFDGTLVFLPVNYKRMRRRLQKLFSQYGIKSSFHPLLGSIEDCLSKGDRKNHLKSKIRKVKNAAYRIVEDEETRAVKEARLAEGAKKVLATLRQRGVKIGIVSRNSRKCIKACIFKFKMLVPDVIVARDDLPSWKCLKPDRRHACLCLKKLKIKPWNAIIVGDSYHDIELGKNAGIKTALIKKPIKPMNKIEPDIILDGLDQIIDNWNKKVKLDKMSVIKHNEGFNEKLVCYRAQKIMELCKGPKILELGCGDGFITRELVRYFHEIIAVDGSEVRIKRAQELIKTIKTKNKVSFNVCLFEDFASLTFYDSVLLSGILEHVEDPLMILKKAKQWIKGNGVIIVVVPNAKSLHRRIGKLMGLIPNVHQLETLDKTVGHKRYYDFDLLKQDIKKAGLKIDRIGGIFLKPFSNKQMESLSPEITDALYKISDELPEYCAEIYVRCTK